MAGHTDNSVHINAPFDLVWETTNDLGSWPELFNEYASVDILRQDGDAVTFRLTMRPDAQGKVWSWVSERVVDREARNVRARRVEVGVFKYMYLFWEYEDTGDGVHMRWVQDFELKPGAFTDDASMTEHLDKSTQANQTHIKAVLERRAAELQGSAR
ncbi:SRPBCC family protein [Flindersiella endophytica]